ncbi:MAG: hypothetical protein JST85_16340 [Acidobacteria bacterium]|nr:hypothetical protein [Acidobacteriota bacterium]
MPDFEKILNALLAALKLVFGEMPNPAQNENKVVQSSLYLKTIPLFVAYLSGDEV